MGGKAGFELGCHPAQQSTNNGGGFNFLGFVKKAASFAYHASGASDVVGCVTHPSWGGCAMAAGAIVLTAVTLGDGAIARMAIEGGAELAVRGAAVRAATSTAGVLSKFGRTLRAEVAVQREALNPVIGSKTFIKVPGFRDSFDGEPLRLWGDHPVLGPARSAKEGATKAGEFFDRLPLSFQDTVVDFLEHALHTIRHAIGG